MADPAPSSRPALDLHFPARTAEPGLPDLVSAALDDPSILAIHETGSEEAPLWRAFFTDAASRDAAAADLTSAFGARGLSLAPVDVEDEDWAARSQADLTAITVGRITVAPPWDIPTAADESHVVLVVQPSMGFGTGHHETTRLCLGMLQALDLAALDVVDVGTGSGVLAMAARRLGARSVTALDHDADALANAHENLTLNGLEFAIDLRQADARGGPLPEGDVVVANLTGALLETLAPALLTATRPGGSLVLSGILRSEADQVAAAFAGGAEVVERHGDGEWVGLFLRRAV